MNDNYFEGYTGFDDIDSEDEEEYEITQEDVEELKIAELEGKEEEDRIIATHKVENQFCDEESTLLFRMMKWSDITPMVDVFLDSYGYADGMCEEEDMLYKPAGYHFIYTLLTRCKEGYVVIEDEELLGFMLVFGKNEMSPIFNTFAEKAQLMAPEDCRPFEFMSDNIDTFIKEVKSDKPLVFWQTVESCGGYDDFIKQKFAKIAYDMQAELLSINDSIVPYADNPFRKRNGYLKLGYKERLDTNLDKALMLDCRVTYWTLDDTSKLEQTQSKLEDKGNSVFDYEIVKQK